MKKLYYTLYIVISCLLIFFLIDFLQFKIIEKNYYKNFSNLEIKVNSYFKYYDNDWFGHSITSYKNYYNKISKHFNENIIMDKNTNRPIILFGCSFAYGCLLEKTQTFAYKISKISKRNIFNKALECCGIQHMYYLLTNADFYNTLPPNPEYVIYMYIPSQLERLNNYIFPNEMLVNGAYLHYDIKNDNLVLRKEITQIYKSFFIKRILAKIDEQNNSRKYLIRKRNANRAVKLFIESRKLLQEKYPDIKFVILKYNSETGGEEAFETEEMWNKLKENNFIIIDSKDIVGKIYTKDDTTKDKIHPNEAAWDLLVPPLAKKLNL